MQKYRVALVVSCDFLWHSRTESVVVAAAMPLPQWNFCVWQKKKKQKPPAHYSYCSPPRFKVMLWLWRADQGRNVLFFIKAHNMMCCFYCTMMLPIVDDVHFFVLFLQTSTSHTQLTYSCAWNSKKCGVSMFYSFPEDGKINMTRIENKSKWHHQQFDFCCCW